MELAWPAELRRLGHGAAGTWLPHAHAIEACLDKAVFYAVLAGHQIPVPRTWLPGQISQVPASGPLVVKPRRGQGSKNVVFCSTRDQARVLCELIPDPVIQEGVNGQEFTADCLVSRDGRASVIIRHRLVVKGGPVDGLLAGQALRGPPGQVVDHTLEDPLLVLCQNHASPLTCCSSC